MHKDNCALGIYDFGGFSLFGFLDLHKQISTNRQRRKQVQRENKCSGLFVVSPEEKGEDRAGGRQRETSGCRPEHHVRGTCGDGENMLLAVLAERNSF